MWYYYCHIPWVLPPPTNSEHNEKHKKSTTVSSWFSENLNLKPLFMSVPKSVLL